MANNVLNRNEWVLEIEMWREKTKRTIMMMFGGG